MWLLSLIVAAAAAAVAAASSAPGVVCSEARLRCAYRKGCGTALSNYMVLCSDVLNEPTDICPEPCEHALIALTSTEEGKGLMNCQCDDEYCVETKKRMEVCRAQVVKAAANLTSSCRLSQLICLADAQCATALDYYHRLCRSMYQGRKCSNKCMNSIEILRKQEKAAALTACQCDGFESYDCQRMQNNLARLCFHKHKKNHRKNNTEKPAKKPPSVEEVKTDTASNVLGSRALILVAVVLILFNT